MEWISVKDRLPEDDQIVLGTLDTNNSTWYKYPTNLQLLNFYNRDGRRFFRDKASLREDDLIGKVIYWMPIPDAPIEKEDVNEFKIFMEKLQYDIHQFMKSFT